MSLPPSSSFSPPPGLPRPIAAIVKPSLPPRGHGAGTMPRRNTDGRPFQVTLPPPGGFFHRAPPFPSLPPARGM